MSTPLDFISAHCQVRILIVTEGTIHFSRRDSGFSLVELLKALRETQRPWEDLRITTARRLEDSDQCCDIANLRFDESTLNIQRYDQLWLIGWYEEDKPEKFLDPTELRTIYAFMNDGGGVFATGDHKSIGYAMCGKIPRVSSMRKWQFKDVEPPIKAPGRDDATRNDTLREGTDSGFQLTDQSDSVPQEIRPKFFANLGGIGSHPHPLLADRGFAITVLPDHQHEGECVIPEDLTRSFEFAGGERFEEYPRLPKSEDRLAPELVAIGTSAAGFLRNESNEPVPPVEPRCFKMIVAYDGQFVERVKKTGEKVHLGRVVVDSTFHHFLDINLNGTGTLDKRGFYDSQGKPTKDLQRIKKYYRNIVTWLLPADRRVDYCFALLLYLRFSGLLVEEFGDNPNPSLKEWTLAGTLTRKAITEIFSAAEAVVWATTLLGTLGQGGAVIERLINPWLPSHLRPTQWAALINSDMLVNLTLGIAMLSVANNAPSDLFEAAPEIARREDLLQGAAAGFIQVATEKLGKAAALLLRSQSELAEF